ncbi:glycosyltransferase involved in cell wall biosynthesis [Granulicella aggregans]|uniref:dolichyl-phosphate beta-glucosyltransferase n=1 Tax=Granulicella aggregans TaxID=474949 RepID=A0A7W8E225_9BACT|nr:dolichyl-phosphate beta-glucosyltransferase [Granulicella aggregans]MBB5055744.1 glycosyltransferase involved in cell wall biosynthesis [Granulicella aggregans]
MPHPYLSIVIPAFNESARIEETLARVMECVEMRGWNAEVLVVDDGSSDDTAEIVQRWMRRYSRLNLVKNPGNRGKGYSVRNGLLQAAGDVVMFTDADLSAPMEEAERLMDSIEGGADVAIGSRWMDRTRQTIHQPMYRRFFGRCFNRLTRTVMGLPFKDTQCGFKAFRRPAAQVIFRLQRIERWGFDPEILFIARKLHFRIFEVPVTWGHDERSRISYLKDGIKMLEELALIRWNSLFGRYDGGIAARKDTSGMVTPQVKGSQTATPVVPISIRKVGKASR